MRLYSRITGEGEPVIILHGLFGMSDNWLSIARSLSRCGYCVHIPDLRNHGRSPHASRHHYADMCDDILEYIDRSKIDTFSLIGHSMGGKLGMIFALLHHELLNRLIVVDIAPSAYDHRTSDLHNRIISTLLEIDLNRHNSRATVKEELSASLGDERLGQFLVKNLVRATNRKGNFSWRLNLPVLQTSLPHLMTGLDDLKIHAPCPVTTLFIKGNDSAYYLPEHEADRINFFPNSRLTTIDNAGHWLHSERTELFLELVTSFFATTTRPL